MAVASLCCLCLGVSSALALAWRSLSCFLRRASLCSLCLGVSSTLSLACHSLSCSLCHASLCSLCSGISSISCSMFSVLFPMSCQPLLSLLGCFLHSSSSSVFSLLLPMPCYPLLLTYYLLLIQCFFGVQYLYVARVLNVHVHHAPPQCQNLQLAAKILCIKATHLKNTLRSARIRTWVLWILVRCSYQWATGALALEQRIDGIYS